MKKIIALALALELGLFCAFSFFEGNLAIAGTTTSTTSTPGIFTITVDVTSEIRLTCPSSVGLSSIASAVGGVSTSTVDCNVATSNVAGYILKIHASTTPAMQVASSSFADYTVGTVTTSWSVGTASSSFGFTISTSTDVVQAFKYDGAACNAAAGSTDGAHCWVGFNGTNDINIASKSAVTNYNGVTTTILFKAEAGATKNQQSAVYVATIVATAVTQ